MSLAADDERISLVTADSVSSSAAIDVAQHHNGQRVDEEIGDEDVKYSAQFLVSILKPVKLNPRSAPLDAFCTCRFNDQHRQVCLTMLLVVIITRIFDPSADPLAPQSSRVVQVRSPATSFATSFATLSRHTLPPRSYHACHAAPLQRLPQTTFSLAYEEKATDSTQQKAEGSLLNAAYFIGMRHISN